MKKLLATFGAILLGLSLVSCGKKIDTSDWIHDFEDAKSAAVKEGKRVLLYISADNSNEKCKALSNSIFLTEEFKSKYNQEFVLVSIDFSDSRFDIFAPNPEDSNSDPKETEKLQNQLNRDMKVATSYGVTQLPTVLILSEQGYFIDQIILEEESDIDDFDSEFSKTKEKIQEVAGYLKTIKNGKKQDVIQAIDSLYEFTPLEFKIPLAELNKKLVSLDKKNEEGLTIKHLYAYSDSTAQLALLEEDYEKALSALELPASYDILGPEDKQQIYYSIAIFMINSGSNDIPRIKGYFQKSVDASPDSPYSEQIKYAIQELDEIANGQAEGPAVPEAAAEENQEPEVSNIQ